MRDYIDKNARFKPPLNNHMPKTRHYDDYDAYIEEMLIREVKSGKVERATEEDRRSSED